MEKETRKRGNNSGKLKIDDRRKKITSISWLVMEKFVLLS